jgi:hypothetical protein
MPRKDKQIDGRRRRDDLRTLDVDSKGYWDEILRRNGLSMTAGMNRRRISYVGGASDLEGMAGLVSQDTGRTRPKNPAE